MFECHITNGTSPLGLSIRYFGYSLLEKPDRVAIPGFVKRSETFLERLNVEEIRARLTIHGQI